MPNDVASAPWWVAVGGFIATSVAAYLVGRQQERAKDAQQRPVVATALLTEIQSAEIALRRLALHKQAANSTVHPSTTNFDAFRSQLVLLDRSLAQSLIVFYGLIAEINDSRRRMKDDEVIPGERAHDFIRTKARFAANRIPDLRTALLKAGGIELPAGEQTWVSGSTAVSLVDPAFNTTRLVPGTTDPPAT